jgi:hypothetical protein
MTNNQSKLKYHGLVHDTLAELKANGVNPDLNGLRHEVLRLHSVDLTEKQVGELLLVPLEGGRRGSSATSRRADSASRRAAMASQQAERGRGATAHGDARELHAEAARLHRIAARYHDQLVEHHTTSGTTDTEAVPIDCRYTAPMQSRLEGDLSNVIMFMPAGKHRINPSRAGKPVTVVVEVDELSAERLEEQRQILEASGGKPFFSIEHETDIAAFWPTKFVWDTRLDATGKLASGVWAEGEWSASGRAAILGKDFRSFSPTFFVNAVRNDPDNPAQVVCNPNARLNFGSVVNCPAFESISPLWSASARR